MFFSVDPILQDSFTKDWDKVEEWLSLYQNSDATFKNYKKEIYRFIYFLFKIEKVDLKHCTPATIQLYLNFLSDPPASMLGPKVSINHEKWRPLNKKLSPSSIKFTTAALKTFFEYLFKRTYIPQNPVEQLPNIKTNSYQDNAARIESETKRYFSSELIDQCERVLKSLQEKYKEKPSQLKRVQRDLFIFRFLYFTMVRISELHQINAKSFGFTVNFEQEKLWYVKVLGKGNKLRILPITAANKSNIEIYLGMDLENFTQQTTEHGQPAPLITSTKNPGAPLKSVQALSYAVKTMFLDVADYIEFIEHEPHKANLIRKASAHWLRHSGGSHLLQKKTNPVAVRDILGHASIATTDTYLHSDDLADFTNAMDRLEVN